MVYDATLVLRKRRKAPKTKTGCRTCKDRRIKCDEERPACRRCVTSDRQCPGYEAPSSAWQVNFIQFKPPGPDIALLNRPPTLPFSITAAESNSFDYIRLRMASSPTSCLSWFPPWATSVVQAGQYNAAVFHAVTALSTMLQCTDDAHGVVGSPTSLGMQMADAKQQFAVDQYCKSMNLMRDLIGKISNGKYTESQAETCLMMCLLFLSIEILQRTGNAMVHYKTALRIIRNYRQGYLSPPSSPVSPDAPGSRSAAQEEPHPITLRTQNLTLMDSLTQTFVKLDTDLSLKGQRELHFIPSCSAMPISFLSLEEAEVYLDVLASSMYRVRSLLDSLAEEYVTTTYPDVSSGETGCRIFAASRTVTLEDHPDIESAIEKIMSELKAYMSAFVAIPMAADGNKLKTHLRMQMYFFGIWVLASTCRSQDELDFDKFNGQFEHMASTAERYFNLHYSPCAEYQPNTLFTLESTTSLCLFTIAEKCRKSSVRRRALALLQRASLCGLFSSSLLAQYAAVLIKLEEERAAAYKGVPYGSALDSSDVPETIRIYDSFAFAESRHAENAQLYFATRPTPRVGDLYMEDLELSLVQQPALTSTQ